VRNLFKNNKLKIHYKCYELIQELETYAYKEKRAGSNEPEEPMKENDHACDALRYPLYMQSGQSAIRRAVQQQPQVQHAYGRRSFNQAHQVG
jgi:phage terminase large subunit